MKIALGADHGGYALKEQLLQDLKQKGHDVVDVGTHSSDSVDYPVFAQAVAHQVAQGACVRGIMIDGAGIGSAMAANKIKGVRAALAYDLSSAVNSREHNDANVLTLGAGLIGPVLARQIVDAWLAAECREERHKRRVAMIEGSAVPLKQSAEPGHGAPAATPSAGASPPPAQDDVERVMRRVEELLGTSLGHTGGLLGSHPRGPSVASSPETARRFLDLGAGRLSTGLASGRIPEDVARFIDHTLLRPNATAEEVRKLCAEAREFGFAAVCVNPAWAKLVSDELKGTGVLTCVVVGFPLGATYPEIKAMEARRAIREGAREIDMVINIGALKGGDDELVLRDIRAVVEACRDGSVRCKVIIETALLTDEEKRRACRLAKRARAHFVKTSTGFASGGATAHDVAIMAEEVAGAGMEVKASGGIRSYADLKRMVEAGATRIGASAGVAIVEEAREITVSE